MATSITSRPARGRCGLCGRIRLSRSEYAWRRANGLPVWRCQHRRRPRSPNRDLIDALLVIAALVVAVAWSVAIS
jgi:hypothetical protein